MKNLLVLLFLFSSIFTWSQVGGESSYNFMNQPFSARLASLGGKPLTILDDVNQPFFNPSVISQNLDNKISVNYLNYLADINYASVSYSRFINKHFGSLYGNISYVDNGQFLNTNSQGEILGDFTSKNITFTIGYARNLPWSNIYAGANLKLISSFIENYSSNGIAIDFGLIYFSDSQPFRITALLRNYGYQFNSFLDQREDLPLDIALGFSYDLSDLPLRWYVTMDNLQKWDISADNPSDVQNTLDSGVEKDKITFLSNASRHFIVGAEFFPKGNFNLRLGYNFRRAREFRLIESRTFSGLNFGFGLKMGRYKFHYAYSKYHPASNSSTFSLDINLDSNIR